MEEVPVNITDFTRTWAVSRKQFYAH